MTTTFTVHAIPAEVLDQVRGTGRDAWGNPVEKLTAEGEPSHWPMRCCLRDAEAGDAVLLFGYEPPIGASPYHEVGPVFAHAEPCGGPASTDFPEQWLDRRQAVRCYDSRGWIHHSEVHDGTDPVGVLERLFADPATVQVHSRNIGHGCFMFAATRS